MKFSKNKKKMFESLDKNKTYEPIEAIKLLKEKSFAKFDETIDVAINLNIDSNKTDQNIKGVLRKQFEQSPLIKRGHTVYM